MVEGIVASVLTWVWTKYGKEILQKTAEGVSKKAWQKVNWLKASQNYADRIEGYYGNLRVLGAGTKPIDEIFTYVNVLEKATAQQLYAPENIEENFLRRHFPYERGERRSALGLVQTGQNYFILGQPGAGKSTFLKSVAIKAVRGELYKSDDKPRVPIFVELTAHANSNRSLLESIAHELDICRFPDAHLFATCLLDSGRAAVLLDGLDEVTQDKQLIREIEETTRKYNSTQFLLTCRVAATEHEFINFKYLEIADFDEGQIQVFMNNWLGDEDKAEACWRELKQYENEGLIEIARIPLLLTLLMFVYDAKLEFPMKRADIYETALDALLTKWDAKKSVKRDEPYKALSTKRKGEMFAHIAYESFSRDDFVFDKRDLAEMIGEYMVSVLDVSEDIDGTAILESIVAQHGIFVKRSHNLYSFSHLSFQEHYGAKYINANTKHGTLDALLQHVKDDQWREVFLLTASLLDEKDADDFFKLFLECVREIVQGQEEVQALLTWANQKTASIASKVRYKRVALRIWFANDSVNRVNLINTLSSYKSIGGFDTAVTLMRKLALIIDRLHATSINADIDFARDLKLEFALHSAVAYAFAYGVDPRLHSSRNRDLFHDLIRALTYSLDLARKCGLETIEQKLSKLNAPDKDASEQIQVDFIVSIHEIFLEFRELSGLELIDPTEEEKATLKLSEKAESIFSTYYEVNNLLVDCLNLVIVTDRDAILNQLFLPASES